MTDDDYSQASIPLVVVTTSDTGETKERVIDHGHKKDRIWLANHCHWAFRNRHSVLIKPVEVVSENFSA